MPPVGRWRKIRLLLALAIGIGLAGILVTAQTSVTLSTAATPAAAQPGVHTVVITGSGFPAGAIAPADVTVTVQPASPGVGATASTSAATVVAMPGTARRITFVIPAAIAVTSPTPYQISIAGRNTAGTTFASTNRTPITANPPPRIVSVTPPVGDPGTTLAVTLATEFTNFVQGSTQANFGPGISVGGAAEGAFGPVTVNSPTSATAQLTIGAAAPTDARTITVRTGVQAASVANAFSVRGQENRPPVISSAPPLSATEAQPYTYAVVASDPDGDAITLSLTEAPSGMTLTGSTVTWLPGENQAGPHQVAVRAADVRGGAATQPFTIQVAAANRPPVVSAGGPYSGSVGEPVSFAGVATDPNGDSLTLSWDFGDQSAPGTAATATHRYSAPGDYTVTFRADDGRGGITTSTALARIIQPNRLPSISAGGPYKGTTGQPVSFAGTATDPDGDPLTLTWDFGDQTDPGAGTTPSHTFGTAGDFAVTFRADDGRGGVVTATALVTIAQSNRLPTVSAGGPYGGNTGESIAFSASADDPDDDPLTFSWDFGDQSAPAEGPTPSHIYAAPGDYTITVTANDGRGGSATATALARIGQANRVPSISAGGPYKGMSGQPVVFAGVASDPDNDPLTLTWDFADQTDPGVGATPSHAFAAAGDYTVTFRADDGRGGVVTATALVTIAQSNRPPAVSAGGPYGGTINEPLTLAGDATDPDDDPLTLTWDFGDQSAPGTGQSPTHTYSAAGDYTVTLTASDGRGGTATATALVRIGQPNRSPSFTSSAVTTAEHQLPYVYQAVATDPDGDALTFTLQSAPMGMTVGPQGRVEWTPAGAQLGPHAVTLVVADPFKASATQSFSVVVSDVTPPAVSLAMPAESLPGTSVTASALAFDNVGVVSVRFEVNGADPQDDALLPFAREITIPGNAIAGTEFHIRAIATDAAGNAGFTDRVFKVAAVPDTVPPTISLNAPPEATPGSTIRVTASALDLVGVRSVLFRVGGQEILSDPDQPRAASYTVPQGTAVGSSLAFTARAFDFSGNFADAAAGTTIVAVPDTTPPTVVLDVGSTIPEGGTLAMTAKAADNVGVANVDFYVNGVLAGTSTGPLYAVSFKLPASVTGGDVLHVEARAIDFSGLSASSERATDVLAAPNRPPTARAGGPYSGQVGQRIQLSAAQSDDPDAGDQLVYNWNFGDDATGTGLTPGHSYAAAGTFTATLTVSDGRGGVDVAEATVVISAATDRQPPSISLTAPSSVLPASQVTVTARAIDDVGVVAVVFEVSGSKPSETSAVPFQRLVDIPGVASPGDTIEVTAIARDAAGNEGRATATMTITGTPDTEPPTVSLNAPPSVGAGTPLHVSASAKDTVGVQSVSFSFNGTTMTTLPAPPYETTYQVPADAVAGSSIGVVVRVTDFNGNSADDSASVTVTQPDQSDTTAPSISLTAPLQVFVGRPLALAAKAQDNVGVASVRFFVDGVNVATVNQQPFAVSLPLGAEHTAGSLLQLRAVAVDYANLEAFDTRQTLVVAADASGQGVVTGEVYDDTRSLPLAGVTVTLTGMDDAGAPYAQSTTTDARGRWSLRAAQGSGIVRIARAGWTSVDRPVSIALNQAIEIVDARLTPLVQAGPALSAVLGGQVSAPIGAGPPAVLAVPPGALATATSLTLTPLSQQGLAGTLPHGWSPVAVADIAPHAVTFNTDATLALPNLFGVAAGRMLVLARWDAQDAVWRAHASTAVPAGDGPLLATVNRAGQYAFLLADSQPFVPPSATAGEAVAGLTPILLASEAVAIVDPQPKVLFYAPDVRSQVTGRISANGAIPSGALVEARIVESYKFLNGTDVRPEPFVEDLFFYQAGEPLAGLAGQFTVTPSQVFEALTLQEGVIAVELLAAPLGPRLQIAFGGDGGTATAGTGESVQLPQGAVTGSVAVTVRGLTAANVGVTLPQGLTFVGSALVTFPGSLAQPATLSVPRPPAVTDASRLLLVRAQEIGGETRLVVVGRAVIVGNQILSDVTLAGTTDRFEGVRVAGRYLFVQTSQPMAFANGRVRQAGGAAAAGAIVASELPLVALSSGNGAYIMAAHTGQASFTALDPVSQDSAAGQATLPTPGAAVALDLQIVPAVPAVTSILPVDGAANVPLASPVVIRFSRAIEPASVNGANAANVLLTNPAGTPIVGTISLAGGNQILTLRPNVALEANTVYTVRVATGVTDMVGRHLPADVTAQFTSLDTAPPPAPAAGSIAASIPNAGGFSTIAATQGSAAVHDTVSVLNLTRGTSTPALVNPDGSFSTAVAVSITDKLQITITDQHGNQTVVPLSRFRQTNADGSVSQAVDAEGGRVDGPGGTAVDVPVGTFPTGAVVTINAVAEAGFPQLLTAEQKTVFAYAGGFSIDFGGAVPTRYVNVSVPAQANDTPDDQWIVGRASTFNGEAVFEMADTAKLIGGRVTTSSPPCPGVTAAGLYGILKSNRTLGITYGPMSADQLAIIARAQAHSSGQPFQMPGAAMAPVTASMQTVCLPVLSGRVTVSLNSATIQIPSTQIEPADIGIVIKHNTTQSEARFSRADLLYSFPVAGSPDDVYEVQVTTPSGVAPVPFKVAPGDAAGNTKILLTPDALSAAVTAVRIARLAGGVFFTNFTAPFALRLPVSGGSGDSFSVKADNPATPNGRPLLFSRDPSALGPEHMVLRALPGVIDPTATEMAAGGITGRARTEVQLINKTHNTTTTVPATAIVKGGIAWAFAGSLLDDYQIKVLYDSGSPAIEDLPKFSVVVSNAAGVPVRTIVFPSPPQDHPLPLGPLTGDTTPPELQFSRGTLRNFDPVEPLTITFSEAIDVASATNYFKVYDSSNHIVHGKLHISNQNRSVTFVPTESLALAHTYVISLVGIVDRGQNPLAPADQWLRIRTVAPRLVTTLTQGRNPSRPLEALKDIQIQRRVVGGQPETTVVAVTAQRVGFRLVTIDVTSPHNPQEMGHEISGAGTWRLQLLPGVRNLGLWANNTCPGGTSTFSGDMALATTFNLDFTFVSFYDVTDRAKPCLMANKILAVNPLTLVPQHVRGTIKTLGFAKGVAAVQHTGGWSAYTAIQHVGLTATNFKDAIPEPPQDDRPSDGLLAGDYVDVLNVSDRLVALNRGEQRLDIVDPNLVVLAKVGLPDGPRRLLYVPGLPFDTNRDGAITSGEHINAAFVGGDNSVVIVDLTDVAQPFLVGRIPFPTSVRDLDVDPGKLRLVAVEERSFSVVDLRKARGMSIVDANGDGVDDRIAWRTTLPIELHTAKIDTVTNHTYVGTEKGLSVYALGKPNVTGHATFTYFPAHPTDGLIYACKIIGGKRICPEERPIRDAVVELRQGTSVLALTNTDDTGYYAFDAPLNATVTVAVKAALGVPWLETVQVVDNTNSSKLYETVSPPFPVSPSTTMNINALTSFVPNVGYIGPREGAPFAILDTIYRAQKTVRAAQPNIVFPKLGVQWSPTNAGDTEFRKSTSTIYVKGVENTNTDEYDAMVIAHEWAHYFFENFSRDDSPGGNHRQGELLDPRLAFSEGAATALAGMVLGERYYVDTGGMFQAVPDTDDLENDSNSNGGFYSEHSVMELLWDLFDPREAEVDTENSVFDADDVELGFKPIFEAFKAARTTPALTSIMSFFHAFLPGYLASVDPALQATGAEIVRWAAAENIDLANFDEYELFNNVTVNGVTSGRLYTELPMSTTVIAHATGPFAGQLLQTRTTHDPGPVLDGNKLFEHVFFKFTVASAGLYQIGALSPLGDQQWLSLKVYKAGQVIAEDGFIYDDLAAYILPLQPGTYVAVVKASTSAHVPTNAIFKMRIQPF